MTRPKHWGDFAVGAVLTLIAVPFVVVLLLEVLSK